MNTAQHLPCQCSMVKAPTLQKFRQATFSSADKATTSSKRLAATRRGRANSSTARSTSCARLLKSMTSGHRHFTSKIQEFQMEEWNLVGHVVSDMVGKKGDRADYHSVKTVHLQLGPGLREALANTASICPAVDLDQLLIRRHPDRTRLLCSENFRRA